MLVLKILPFALKLMPAWLTSSVMLQHSCLWVCDLVKRVENRGTREAATKNIDKIRVAVLLNG